MDTNEYIGAGEVAKILHVSPKTVARWSNDKTLPAAFVTFGGHRRWNRKEILDIEKEMKDNNG